VLHLHGKVKELNGKPHREPHRETHEGKLMKGTSQENSYREPLREPHAGNLTGKLMRVMRPLAQGYPALSEHAHARNASRALSADWRACCVRADGGGEPQEPRHLVHRRGRALPQPAAGREQGAHAGLPLARHRGRAQGNAQRRPCPCSAPYWMLLCAAQGGAQGGAPRLLMAVLACQDLGGVLPRHPWAGAAARRTCRQCAPSQQRPSCVC
jgi:hypothetical protein